MQLRINCAVIGLMNVGQILHQLKAQPPNVLSAKNSIAQMYVCQMIHNPKAYRPKIYMSFFDFDFDSTLRIRPEVKYFFRTYWNIWSIINFFI